MKEQKACHGVLHTTVYLRKDRKRKVKNGARNLKIPMKQLLSLLLNKARLLFDDKPLLFENVAYQPRIGKEHYEITSVTLHSVDHEYAVAGRNLFKISVSLLLAHAIDNFLDDILENGIELEEGGVEKEIAQRKKYNYKKYRIAIRDYGIKHWYSGAFEYWELRWDRQNE